MSDIEIQIHNTASVKVADMIKVKRGDGWWCFACGDVWKGNDAWSSETNLSVVWSAMWNDYFSRRIHIIVIVLVYCMEHCVAHQYFKFITAIWEGRKNIAVLCCAYDVYCAMCIVSLMNRLMTTSAKSYKS